MRLACPTCGTVVSLTAYGQPPVMYPLGGVEIPVIADPGMNEDHLVALSGDEIVVRCLGGTR